MEVDDDRSVISFDVSITSSDTNDTNEDDDATVNIAADGDVIMVVGPKKKEFRLYSFFLKTTSKVFKAMLGPNFAEGQQLNANEATGNRELVKINLPEDDAKSMGFIFRATHHRYDAFDNPEDIPFFEILVAADKYDMVHAIKHAFHHALLAVVAREDPTKGMFGVKLWKFTMASAFVSDAAAFKAATRSLVLHEENNYLDFAKRWFFNELFALRVCANLEQKRACCRQRAMLKLLRACICERESIPIFSSLRIKCTLRVTDPDEFVESSVSRHLDLIEDCVEYQKGTRHTNNKVRYWMDVLKEDAGLDLAHFV